MVFSFIINLFTQFVYQPFFNLLVAVYYLLEMIPGASADMGIAVIIFTVIFRIIWLPISFSADRKEGEKRQIAAKMKEIQAAFANNPVHLKKEEKKLLNANKGLLIATYINIGFQVIIALMLFRIFTKGLEGADLHLLYRFIHQPKEPFNLMFLGKYDLSHPSIFLNLIQTACIFIIEILSVTFSPFPAKKRDMTAVFVLPLIAYIFFSRMPAGKKLFVIVTLIFSIGLMLVKRVIYWYHSINTKVENWVAAKTVDKPAEASKNGV